MTHHRHHHHHGYNQAHEPQIRSAPSILLLSAAERLLAVAVLAAGLWAAIFWAMG